MKQGTLAGMLGLRGPARAAPSAEPAPAAEPASAEAADFAPPPAGPPPQGQQQLDAWMGPRPPRAAKPAAAPAAPAPKAKTPVQMTLLGGRAVEPPPPAAEGGEEGGQVPAGSPDPISHSSDEEEEEEEAAFERWLEAAEAAEAAEAPGAEGEAGGGDGSPESLGRGCRRRKRVNYGEMGGRRASARLAARGGASDSDDDFVGPKTAGPPRLKELDARQVARFEAFVRASADLAGSRPSLLKAFKEHLEAGGDLRVMHKAVIDAFPRVAEWVEADKRFYAKADVAKLRRLRAAQARVAEDAGRGKCISSVKCSLVSVLQAALDGNFLTPGTVADTNPLKGLTIVAYLGWRSRTQFRIACFDPPDHGELMNYVNRGAREGRPGDGWKRVQEKAAQMLREVTAVTDSADEQPVADNDDGAPSPEEGKACPPGGSEGEEAAGAAEGVVAPAH